MRKVNIPVGAKPPDDWLAEAKVVANNLRSAKTQSEREQIIEKHEKLWRDDRIRNWLFGLFHNKCWYTEAEDSVSALHVDHYRPKGRVTDCAKVEVEGYWWLAFDWTNYRICGQLINVKKRDYFPIIASESPRATADNPKSTTLEAAVLIDPITEDTGLISFELDEDGCRAVPAAGIGGADKHRADTTIDILGLNRLDRLNQKRADVWNECRAKIIDYTSAADEPQCLRTIRQHLAIQALRNMIRYEKEFSSVASACIQKHAHEAIRTKVYS